MEKSIHYSVITRSKAERYKIKLRDFLVLIVSIISSCIFFFVNEKQYCNSIAILPILFGICYIIFVAPVMKYRKSRTLIVFSVCEFLRCVLHPLIIAFSDYSGFGVYSTTDGDLILHAVLLMAWEMLILFVFLNVYIRNHRVAFVEKHEVKLAENKYAIYLIIAIGLLIFGGSPQIRRYINFLSLSAASDKIRSLEAGGGSSILSGLISVVHDAFLCIFILILDTCANKYQNTKKRIYIWISTLAGLITISVIFGESRAVTIYTLYAVSSCLRLKYKEKNKAINIVLIVGAIAVLIGMTIYRLFAVYAFGSYAEAIANGGYMGQYYFSRFAEGYLLGPQSIAAGIEFKKSHLGAFTFERFFFDFFRPFMGINLVTQRINMDTTISLYNSWLTGIEGRSNGYFLQITSQCFCFLGTLFSPLYAGFFLWLSMRLENVINRTNNLFVYFFLSYVFIRTSSCVLGGTMSGYISNSTMVLLVCGFFFIMQRVFSTTIRKGMR